MKKLVAAKAKARQALEGYNVDLNCKYPTLS